MKRTQSNSPKRRKRKGHKHKPATGGTIIMEGGYKPMEVGGTGVFQLQPNGAITPGSVAWSADDTNVTLTPSADGLSVQAVDAAGDTATQFTLTADFEDSNGNALVSTLTVMLQGAAPAPPAPATAGVIEQIA